jgi:hypothetical protein
MSTPSARARPFWRRALRGAVLIALALLAAAFLVRMAVGYWTARQLHAELTRIRNAGEPVTLKELRLAQPEADEVDDAWPFDEAALALVQRENLDDAETWSRSVLRSVNGPLTKLPLGPEHDVAERVLANNALTIDMLQRGARCPACRGDSGIEQGMDFFLDRLTRVRALAKLLALRAHQCIASGDGDGAVESLTMSLKLLRILDSQPVLLVTLVRVSTLERVSEDVRLVLQLRRPSDAALLQLQDALLAADAGLQLERLGLAERAYGIESMRNLIAAGLGTATPPGEPSSVPMNWPCLGWWTRPWVEHRAVQYLRGMSGFVDATQRPWSQALEAMRHFEQKESPADQVPGDALSRAVGLAARAVALTRAAAVVVMIERYRAANGALPDSPSELVPAYGTSLPTDPFNSQDLRYLSDTDSYVVYSVGANLADDQGAVVPDEEGEEPSDVGVRVRFQTTP